MKKLYIGLDAHKSSIAIGIAHRGDKPAVFYGKCSSDIDRLVRAIRKILKLEGVAKEEARLCYEAGPTGFVLASRFRGRRVCDDPL